MRFWLAILFTLSLTAATRTEYRGFWVDTFNSNLNSHADVVTVVRGAKSARANAIFAQVRRRGDAWYLNSLEPPPDFVPLEALFDPLLSALAPPLLGVAMFSLAVPDAAVDTTPARGLAEFAAAVTKPEGVFFEPAIIPALAWKVAPARGHLLGFAGALDGAEVALYNEQGQVARITVTDGSGFFGLVDLPPGRYVALVESGGERKLSRPVVVEAGKVGVVGFE